MASKKQNNSTPARKERSDDHLHSAAKRRSNHDSNGTKTVAAASDHWFSATASYVSRLAGKPITFLLASGTILVWAVTGPVFHFSDTWQLVINTGTTIVTFLMVFLIQNTQNRDALAIQVKLSELIVAVKGAHNRLAAIEEKSEDELEEMKEEVHERAEEAEESVERVSKETHRVERRHGARSSS
jgi:low affinity Fe/Cu permease